MKIFFLLEKFNKLGCKKDLYPYFDNNTIKTNINHFRIIGLEILSDDLNNQKIFKKQESIYYLEDGNKIYIQGYNLQDIKIIDIIYDDIFDINIIPTNNIWSSTYISLYNETDSINNTLGSLIVKGGVHI